MIYKFALEAAQAFYDHKVFAHLHLFLPFS